MGHTNDLHPEELARIHKMELDVLLETLRVALELRDMMDEAENRDEAAHYQALAVAQIAELHHRAPLETTRFLASGLFDPSPFYAALLHEKVL